MFDVHNVCVVNNRPLALSLHNEGLVVVCLLRHSEKNSSVRHSGDLPRCQVTFDHLVEKKTCGFRFPQGSYVSWFKSKGGKIESTKFYIFTTKFKNFKVNLKHSSSKMHPQMIKFKVE